MDFFERLYTNFFDVKRITTARLANFAEDAISRTTANDSGHLFTSIIESLTTAAGVLRDELVAVSGGEGTQKGHTILTDAVVEDFRNTMRELEPEISYRLKGPKSVAYLELYPGGKTEYHRATKANMATLTQRVGKMASKYATALGDEVVNRLKIFAQDWEHKRDDQQQQEGTMDTDRTERSAARRALEVLLMKLMFKVGDAFTGETEKCNSFFNFELLDATKHPSLDRE